MEKGAKGGVACLMVSCKKPLAVVVAALVLLLIALMRLLALRIPKKPRYRFLLISLSR